MLFIVTSEYFISLVFPFGLKQQEAASNLAASFHLASSSISFPFSLGFFSFSFFFFSFALSF